MKINLFLKPHWCQQPLSFSFVCVFHNSVFATLITLLAFSKQADAQQPKFFAQSYVRYAGGRVYDFRNIVYLVSEINSLNGVSSSSEMAIRPESIKKWPRELDYMRDENGRPVFDRPAPSVANNRLRSLVIQNEDWNNYRVNGSPVALTDGTLLVRLTSFKSVEVSDGLPPFSNDRHIEYQEHWTYVVVRNYPQGPGYYPREQSKPFELLAIPTASKQGFNFQLPAGPNGVLSGSFPVNYQFQVYDYGIPCDFSSSRTNELLLAAAKTNKYLRQFIPIVDTNTFKQISK